MDARLERILALNKEVDGLIERVNQSNEFLRKDLDQKLLTTYEEIAAYLLPMKKVINEITKDDFMVYINTRLMDDFGKYFFIGFNQRNVELLVGEYMGIHLYNIKRFISNDEIMQLSIERISHTRLETFLSRWNSPYNKFEENFYDKCNKLMEKKARKAKEQQEELLKKLGTEVK